MAVTQTTNLGLPIITTGTESGNWGDIVDNGLTSYMDIAVTGTLSLTSASFTANALTLANTFGTSSATNIAASTAQYAILKLSSLAANVTITAPSVSKTYVVANTDSSYTATIKASGQTGVIVAAGEMAVVWFNGTDYVKTMSQLVYASYRIPYGNGSMNFSSTDNLSYNGTTLRVGANSLLGGATNPIVGMTGSQDNYIQSYIYNAASTGNASSDFVAYADNSTDAAGWVDLGYTSSTFSAAAYTVTGPNESYLFASALNSSFTGNMVYATDSTGSENAHQWYVDGFDKAKGAWSMQLDSTGLQLETALSKSYGGTGLTSAGTAGNVLVSDGTNWTSAAVSTSKIQSISASVATSALTISASALTLDFRSATLSSGTVTTVSGTPSNLVVPSGTTLGTIAATQSRQVVLALNNAGTIELAVSNIAGGTDLTETGLITTNAIAATSSFTGTIAVTTGILTLNSTATGTFALGQAISGTNVSAGTYIISKLSGTLGVSGSTYQTNQYTAASATTMNAVAGMGAYSTTARTNVAYRVLGYIESTQATAGTWATAPSTIQGVGGQALTAMSSLGYSQTWQDVTSARALSTTYYNTTGRPIYIYAWNNLGSSGNNILYINGVGFISNYGSASNQVWVCQNIIPPGASYSITMANGGPASWFELR